MNDIEVLEELIKNEHGELLNCWDYGEEAKKAIENLLKERQYYKECLEATSKYLNNIAYDQIPMAIEDLRQSDKAKIMHYEKLITNGLASKEITKLNEELLAEVQTNYIPKSLIKEKIEEYINSLLENLDEDRRWCDIELVDNFRELEKKLLKGKI